MDAEERWTQRKEWEQESKHGTDCICVECHKYHAEDSDEVEHNATMGYSCCQAQIEDWQAKGMYCPAGLHGSAYMNEIGQCNECLDAWELSQNDAIDRAQGNG